MVPDINRKYTFFQMKVSFQRSQFHIDAVFSANTHYHHVVGFHFSTFISHIEIRKAEWENLTDNL